MAECNEMSAYMLMCVCHTASVAFDQQLLLLFVLCTLKLLNMDSMLYAI